MKILLLGAGGFVGRSLYTRLEIENEVIPVFRSTNINQLSHHGLTFDYIINCASSNPNAMPSESRYSNYEFPKFVWDNFYFDNWLQIESYFQLQIPFGRSDAYTLDKQEFSNFIDRSHEIHSTRRVRHLYLPHVFGVGDRPGRLISSAINALKTHSYLETSLGTQQIPILHIGDATNGVERFLSSSAALGACEPFWYGPVSDLIREILRSFPEARIEFGKRPAAIDANYPQVEFPPRVPNWQASMQFDGFISWIENQID